MLKIGLDLRGLDPNFKAHSQRGTGRYIRELSKQLLNKNLTDIKFLPLRRENIGLNSLQKKILNNLPRGQVTFESQICLRENIKSTKCDMVHFFSHGDAPAYPLTPQIVSILDLIPLRFPDLYQSGPLNLRFKFARFLENRSAKSAKGIIAISEATKKDVIEILNIPEEKIRVTHLGVDKEFLSSSLEDGSTHSIREKYNLPLNSKLALYVGGLDARKNIKFLINLIKELNKVEARTHLKKELKIALVGNFKTEKTYPELKTLIEHLGLADKFIFLGFVENTDLIRLYKNTDIFIFPSLYEGFGLPVLEAMASGALVVAGNNSCMKEVMGNDKFLFPDNKISVWCKGIIDLLNARDKNDSNIEDELKNNLKRAKTFTWEKTLEQTLEAYKYFNES